MKAYIQTFISIKRYHRQLLQLNEEFSLEKLRGDFLYLTVQVYIVVHFGVALTLKLFLS